MEIYSSLDDKKMHAYDKKFKLPSCVNNMCAQGDEAKTAELAPSGFDVKSFPRQS